MNVNGEEVYSYYVIYLFCFSHALALYMYKDYLYVSYTITMYFAGIPKRLGMLRSYQYEPKMYSIFFLWYNFQFLWPLKLLAILLLCEMSTNLHIFIWQGHDRIGIYLDEKVFGISIWIKVKKKIEILSTFIRGWYLFIVG